MERKEDTKKNMGGEEASTFEELPAGISWGTGKINNNRGDIGKSARGIN